MNRREADEMHQLALQAADEAVERARRNANAAWLVTADAAVYTTACRMPTFTTDDVWLCMESWPGVPEQHEPRAMGAVMRKAVREGVCVPTGGYERSSRPECHARPVRVWRSLVFGGKDAA